MQIPSSAAMRDQLNEMDLPVQSPSGFDELTQTNPIPWPVSLSAGGTNNRASVTRMLPLGRGTIGSQVRSGKMRQAWDEDQVSFLISLQAGIGNEPWRRGH